MRTYILSFSEKAQFSMIVFGTILIAFVAAGTINVLFGSLQLISKVELITATYAVLGTIYAVLIAFSISGVWQNYCACALAVSAEAATLIDLVHIVKASNNQKSEQIRHLAISYVKKVIDIEWPMLATGNNEKIMSPQSETLGLAMNIMYEIQTADPTTTRDTVVFSHALTLLTKWLDARRTRIMISKGNTAKALWPLLIAGALILFSLHGLFIAQNPALWATLLVFFSGIVGLSFYLIFTLDAPYSGSTVVDANPFYWTKEWLVKETDYDQNRGVPVSF